MSTRTLKAAHPETASSAAMLLLELEMPQTTAFVAFEEWFDAELLGLEGRFRDFVTRDSLAGSIGR